MTLGCFRGIRWRHDWSQLTFHIGCNSLQLLPLRRRMLQYSQPPLYITSYLSSFFSLEYTQEQISLEGYQFRLTSNDNRKNVCEIHWEAGQQCLTMSRQTEAIRKCACIYLWQIMSLVSVFRQYLLENDKIWRIPLFQMVINCVKCPQKKKDF